MTTDDFSSLYLIDVILESEPCCPASTLAKAIFADDQSVVDLYVYASTIVRTSSRAETARHAQRREIGIASGNWSTNGSISKAPSHSFSHGPTGSHALEASRVNSTPVTQRHEIDDRLHPACWQTEARISCSTEHAERVKLAGSGKHRRHRY